MEDSVRQISLLYVDDEAILLESTKRYLEFTGNFLVDTVSSAKEGLKKLQDQKYDVVVSDYQMPEIDGLKFLRTLRAEGNTIPFIIFTGRGREEIAIEALNAGADYYLQKGGKPKVQFGELRNFVRQAVEKNRAEGLYHTVFENTGTAMLILEEDDTISHVNEEMVKVCGFSKEELEGQMKWPEQVVKEDLDKMLEFHQLRQMDPDFVPKQYELRLIHRNGEIRTVDMTAAMIPGTGKSIISFIDITVQKETEKKLKFTQFSVDNAPDAILWTDFDGNFIAFNKGAVDLLGYSEEELLNMGISHFYKNFSLNRFHMFWEQNTIPSRLIFETELTKKDGSSLGVEFSIVSLKYDSQNYGCAFVRNIADRKKVEGELHNTRERLEMAIDVGEHGFWDWNLDTDEIYFSPRYYTMLGYEPGELPMLPSTWDDLLHPDDRQWVVPQIRESVQNAQPYLVDFRLRKKDGGWKWISGRGKSYEVDEEGIPHRAVGVHVDITDRKQAEITLKTLNKKLNLLSSITRHDIINQLSVVMLYEDLLKDEIDDENVQNYLQSMIGATEMIEQIIVSSRDYQDIGVYSPAWQSVESVAHSVALQISSKDIQVKVDTGTLEIFADPMFNKVIYNLFENAARHGGHVTEMSVSFYEKEEHGFVIVEDNGTGIAGGMKQKIFERGVGSNTGFGLFLITDILGMTGITISETGTEGTGARFEILVPKDSYRFTD